MHCKDRRVKAVKKINSENCTEPINTLCAKRRVSNVARNSKGLIFHNTERCDQ
jgi:hypothetical protein